MRVGPGESAADRYLTKVFVPEEEIAISTPDSGNGDSACGPDAEFRVWVSGFGFRVSGFIFRVRG